MSNQCKCGSLDFFVEKQGNNTGLYCSMCGRWQKWLNKDEIRLFEHNNPSKQNKQTNADKIRAMTDEELAEWLTVIDHYWDDGECVVNFGDAHVHDSKDFILEWLQSEAEQKGKA